MSTHTTVATDPYAYPSMSASGARLKSIRSVAALTFFEQFAAPIPGVLRRVGAWGAFEDGATLIGAAALARVSGATFWAQVVVAPVADALALAWSCSTLRSGKPPRLGGEG